MKYSFILLFLLFSLFPQAHAQDFHSVDQKAKEYGYTKDYRQAAMDLTVPYPEDKLKLRAIFTWIVSNIGYDNKPLEEFQKTGVRGRTEFKVNNPDELQASIHAWQVERIELMLKRKKGVCMDYAFLFNHMCAEIGIESRYVSGFGRFSPHNMGREHQGSNHAWNAVLLDDGWHLIDATWSTGMGQEKSLTEGYFLVDPAIFIHNHHPDSAHWQLLEDPVSVEEFAGLAFLQRGFLEYRGVDFQPRMAEISKKEESTLYIKFKQPLPGTLMIMEGDNPLFPEVEQDGGNYEVTYTPTRPVPRLVSLAILLESGRIEPLITYKSK